MSTRTTIATLETLVSWLNKLTKQPLTPYTTVDGKPVSNIGNYHLYEANGGIGLHRMANTGGGVNTIFELTTKRELEVQLRAYLRGVEAA